MRLGYVLMDSGRCREAVRDFTAAIDGHLPGADAHLGLAGCEIAAKEPAAAQQTLTAGARVEPGQPGVLANLGLLLSDTGHPASRHPATAARADASIPICTRLGSASRSLSPGRGRRAEAAREAAELLRRVAGRRAAAAGSRSGCSRRPLNP